MLKGVSFLSNSVICVASDEHQPPTSEIMKESKVQGVVAADLVDATKHALLKQYGFQITVSV